MSHHDDSGDVEMVDETISNSEQVSRPTVPVADMVGTSTLVFRPAPSAFSALSAPSASSVAPNDLSPAFAALPPLEQAMPSRAMRRRIADLPLEDDRASHFFLAGAGVRDPDQNRIFVAAAGVKLDYEVQVVKSQMDETSEDVNSCRGYVDSLRHHQKVKNLWVTGLITLIKEHGTPELKAGLKDLEQEIMKEEKRLDDLWREKKKGSTEFPDLDPDVL